MFERQLGDEAASLLGSDNSTRRSSPALALTIAIPTFDRPRQLATTLLSLMPQVDERTRVVVLDNASPSPAIEVIEQLGLDDIVEVRRHPVNIGAPANFLRCFEVAATEWMWILSDDDAVAEDAVEAIFKQIDRCDEEAVIAFPAIAPPGVSARGTGWREFIESGIRWTDVLFLPVMIYRVEVFRPYLRHGYAIGLDGYAAVLRRGLSDDMRFVLSDRPLVRWSPPEADARWSTDAYMLSAPLILDDIADDQERQRLGRDIATWPDASPASLARGLAQRYPDSPGYARYLLDQIYWRFQYHDHTSRQTADWLLWRFLIEHPRVLEFLRQLKHPWSRHRSPASSAPQENKSMLGHRL